MEFIDDYTHNLPELIYFAKSIPSKEIETEHNITLPGCECKDYCTIETCCCMKRSGALYKYNNKGKCNSYSISETDANKPIYECNENCTCISQICGNKLVQFGPRTHLQVRTSTGKGLGLFTTRPINKGNFICEYAGEVLAEPQALQRFKQNKTKKLNFIFCINENFGMRNQKTFIDPTHYGNIGRYINHSCEPNCKLYVIRINDTIPGLYVFADEDIGEGAEITFNYGSGAAGDELTDRTKCLCGSGKCTGFLPFDIFNSK